MSKEQATVDAKPELPPLSPSEAAKMVTQAHQALDGGEQRRKSRNQQAFRNALKQARDVGVDRWENADIDDSGRGDDRVPEGALELPPEEREVNDADLPDDDDDTSRRPSVRSNRPAAKPAARMPSREAVRRTVDGEDDDDGTQAAARAAAPGPAALPARMQLVYRGAEIEVTTARAVQLAQQGLDYEQKMARLGEEREAFAQQANSFKAYEGYVKWLEKHPPAAELIQKVLNFVETHHKTPLVDFDPTKGTPESNSDPVLLAEVRDLRQRFAKQDLKDHKNALARLMMDAVASRPVLAALSERSIASGRPDLALKKLADKLSALPGADIDVVADALALEMQESGETLGPAAYVNRKREDSRKFASTRAGDAAIEPPAQRRDKPLTGKDLKNGGVLAAARRRALET